MWAFSLFSRSHVGHVNHGKSENICGVGVSSTFLAVMRCSYQFFAVLRYSELPNAPPLSRNTESAEINMMNLFESHFIAHAIQVV